MTDHLKIFKIIGCDMPINRHSHLILNESSSSSIKMKGEERVEITHGLCVTNVILTSKTVSFSIY